jgi:hypothetical protein
MASPRIAEARLSAHSKDESTREESPSQLNEPATENPDKNGSEYSASPVDPPVEQPSAQPETGAALEKQPSKEVLERSLLKTVTLMFALCVRLKTRMAQL